MKETELNIFHESKKYATTEQQLKRHTQFLKTEEDGSHTLVKRIVSRRVQIFVHAPLLTIRFYRKVE